MCQLNIENNIKRKPSQEGDDVRSRWQLPVGRNKAKVINNIIIVISSAIRSIMCTVR